MSLAIKVDHISKEYTIRHQKEQYTALRDVVAKKVKGALRSIDAGNPRPTREKFFALNDVSFEASKGDRIGIIGSNGAGKSTLLKVLSRITEPTSGRIGLKGRVACLLEVGTGFHPELTGRENIFQNGAVLGMKRAEIKKKFDEIVEFSGVEKFLDTPVKRYSSGMYVRLGFAVAAHLESEILIVDEVLSMGDMEFQKKCFGKMQELAKSDGRTVFFVSHNMQAVTNLCQRVLLLKNGSLVDDGAPLMVVRNYLMFESSKHGVLNWDEHSALGDATARLMSVKILDEHNNVRNHFFSKSRIRVQMDVEIKELNNDLVIGFDITNEEGIVILRTYQNDSKQDEWPPLQLGLNTIYCDIPGEFFNIGTYYICPKISIHCKRWIVNENAMLSFDIEMNHGVSPFWNAMSKNNRPGFLAMIIPWKKAN